MDPVFEQMGLIQDSQRLLRLTRVLNLEDYDKMSSEAYSMFYPLVVDFIRLQDHVQMQQRICYRYGLDNSSFDQSAFRNMKGIVFHMATLPEAFETYCLLKSQLFLEQNDFLDDIIQRVEEKTAACTSGLKMERLMLIVLLIRDVYDAIL